jgi:soluble lytic murein transglycosylase-like protein/TolA-binding protein
LIKTEEALTFAEAGRWDQALTRLEEVVATYPESPFIARLNYEKARVLEAMGRTSDAVHQYQKLRLNYPSRPAGDVAGRRLKHLKKKDVRIPHLRAETIFQHARQLRLNRQYRAALDRFERLEKRGLSRDLEARVDIQKALIAFARQDNQIALELLGSLRERAREDPVDSIDRRLIFSLLSQTYARLGYQKKAVMALKQEYKSHSSTVRKKKLAEFYKSHGKTQKAFQLFDRLNPYWWSGSWTRAWLLFKNGEYRRAKKAFLSLKRRNRSPEALKYKYWAARAMAKSGEYRHARRLFASIVEVAPFDYYGIQARHQLTRGLQSNQRPALSLDSVAKRVASHDVTGTFDDVMRVGVVDRPPNRSLMERLRLQPKIPGAKTGAGVRRYGGESSNCVEKTRERSVESQPGDILDKLVGSTSCGLSGLASLGDGPAVLERSNEPASAKFKWQAPERHRAEGSQPFPERSTAYLSSPGLESMNEFERRWRRLFPEFSRAKWLYMTGFRTSARQELRNIYTEIKAVRNRGYPRQKPHDLSDISVNDYYIDRRRDRSGFWGIEKHRALVTAPQTTAQKRRQLNRQQRIARQGEQLISGLLEPLKVVGNHHLVRDITSYRTSYPNSLVGQASLRKHRDAWSNLYPRAYSHHVLRVAHDSEVNPYLIWSLMGIESSYNPDSISVAEAIGLLQMIPSTGKKVADRLQQEETFGAYKLLEPEHSVEYGVYYFKQLLEKFHGQHILAIPAYNAGPHRVASWVEKRGHLRLDEFIEDIPFSEARNYTKKAIESMARYTHVYEPEFDFRLGSRINPRYRADPDF